MMVLPLGIRSWFASNYPPAMNTARENYWARIPMDLWDHFSGIYTQEWIHWVRKKQFLLQNRGRFFLEWQCVISLASCFCFQTIIKATTLYLIVLIWFPWLVGSLSIPSIAVRHGRYFFCELAHYICPYGIWCLRSPLLNICLLSLVCTAIFTVCQACAHRLTRTHTLTCTLLSEFSILSPWSVFLVSDAEVLFWFIWIYMS